MYTGILFDYKSNNYIIESCILIINPSFGLACGHLKYVATCLLMFTMRSPVPIIYIRCCDQYKHIPYN